MSSHRERTVRVEVEADPRVEQIRKAEEALFAARYQKRQQEYELASRELALQGVLIEFYSSVVAGEKLKLPTRTVIQRIKTGLLFGLQVDGKWYVEKLDVESEVERTE